MFTSLLCLVFHAAYAQSKLANVLFVQELAKRFASEGILAYTLHPGGMNSASNIGTQCSSRDPQVIPTNGGMELPKDYLAQFGEFETRDSS